MQNKSKTFYGLIGYPVKHSLSPFMHNAAFKALGIRAQYVLFEKKLNDVKDFLKKLCEKNINGLNVTIPYKEVVLEYLQWRSPEVKFTQAVNVIVVKECNFLEGWNTDGMGFHRHLTRDLKFYPKGKKIIILGAGGAAKAVANQLARSGAQQICLYDIDKAKSTKLADKITSEFPNCKICCIDILEDINLKNFHLLINATPVGMRQSDPSLVDEDKFHSRLLVYDLIYNPQKTKLLQIAKKKGAAISNGLGMLLYQGAQSFELWTEKPAPIEVMRKALMEAVKKI